MTKVGDDADERAVYTSPCIVRISDLNRGEGQQACMPSGSGDALWCETGNSAGGTCLATGNNPGGQGCNNGSVLV
jgi:hypothetical protein